LQRSFFTHFVQYHALNALNYINMTAHTFLSSSLAGLLAFATLASSTTVSQLKYPVIENGATPAQFTYPGYALDGPRVDHVNSTSFEWWYFDMVNDNVANGDLSSVVAVFHDGTSGGFQAMTDSPNKLPMSLAGTFPNGTVWWVWTYADVAVVTADETHSRGSWGGLGSWDGDLQSGVWEAKFDLEAYGVNGSFRLETVC
jgi:hypothetical protein